MIVTSHSHQPRISLYTYTYTYIHLNNNAVLEELLRKLACCRYVLSSEEPEEHLSSYQVSSVSGVHGRASGPQCRSIEALLTYRERLGNVGPEGITEYVDVP